MDPKSIVWICMAVGSFLGSCIPLLWGAGMLSVSSLVFGSAGAVAGIYAGYKLTH